ncbi:MAG: YidC/Oxa1 family membrane protein insertase [Eubacteriales bacterium]|nr:YidC/Oxa1 family membrane protein insertase [Eubacteriales bacterium]
MDFFVQILRQAIEWIYGFCGDYGIAIVLITAAIRVLLLPLNIRQRKQMRKQQEIAGEAEALREKYKNQQQKLNEELGKLYQEKGTGMGSCLVSFLQFPIMMCLYNGIRLTAAAGAATVLLPWVSSLLVRDRTMILPIATLAVQLLPQTYPYIRYFRALNLQKMPVQMILILLLTNSMFAFAIPSGIGLYYFVSGLFTAVEQLAVYMFSVRRLAV